MFRLVTEIVAPWPVNWKVVDAAGQVTEASVTLNFMRMGEEAASALFDSAQDLPQDLPAPETRRAHNRAFFDRTVRGWSGVVGADDKPLPFTDANIELLLDFPGFAQALGVAYFRFHKAIPEEVAKNSGPSHAGGQAAAGTTAEAPTIATA